MSRLPHTGGEGSDLERYLRALWGGQFRVEFAPVARSRGAFDGREQVLPPRAPDSPNAELTRARVAHAAAHSAYSGARFEVGSLKPLQQVLVALFEDARVEALAIQRFPGLRRLWAPFYRTFAPTTPLAPLTALLARLARALFDAAYVDPDAWIQRARSAFAEIPPDASSAERSRRLGNLLGNDLGQMRLPFDARQYLVEPAYRDDHSGLWEQPPLAAKSVSAAESERDDSARLQPSAPTTHAYPEWDYLIRRERPAFCELSDAPAVAAPGALGEAAPPALVQRLRQRLRQALGVLREERRVADGPELDLSAVVDAAAERAAGRSSTLAVYRRPQRRARHVSALLLLDLSESSNARLADGSRACELTAACARLLCSAEVPALELAIDGFNSYGRKEVRYTRFKDFAERGELAAARLGQLRAAGSTRLGVAVRHACARLKSRPAADKTLVIVSDGEPSDVDIHDQNYFVEDARAAVNAARRAGIVVFACCLPGGKPHLQRRIFGRQQAQLEVLGDLPPRLHAAFSARSGRRL